MADTYCPLPWIGLNVAPGEITPCCQWTGIGEESADSAEFNKIRQDMLDGKELSGCTQCYAAERVGAASRRQDAIEKYGKPTEINLQLLDISFDNVCNLKCRGCCSTGSHLWYNDEKELYGTTFIDNKYSENEFNVSLKGLTYISVSGGEPFLSKKFEKFAERLYKENVVEKLFLSITSNATTPAPDIISKLMIDANELSLSLSIDGLGDLNHYFRHGADFNTCLKNIETFKHLKKLREGKETHLQIHTTVSIYNVNFLKDIEDFFKNNYPEFECTHRVLYWPEQLCIKNAPEELKEQIRPIVESYGEKYIDVLNELNTVGADTFDHFINFHNSLDTLRNESLETANPLLFKYIKSYRHTPTDSKVFFLKQMDALK
jgi:MoaA/NifB/PqqE/SkfB family radical SAM enzyme